MNFCEVFGFYKIEVKSFVYFEHKFEGLSVMLKENEAVGRAELEEGKKGRGRSRARARFPHVKLIAYYY